MHAVCRVSVNMYYNYAKFKTDTVPCVQAASPFFTTPWQSLIVPQDISLKATQRISECLLFNSVWFEPVHVMV